MGNRPGIISIILLLAVLLGGCNSNSTDITNILSPYLIPSSKNTKLMRISSKDSLGNNSINILAGTSMEIVSVQGPAIITRIWLDIPERDPVVLRQLLIRMYWDNEKEPSVEVPFADFFGCAFDYREVTSRFLVVAGGGYSSFFPMPFEKDARIVIINESATDLHKVSFQVDYQKIETFLSRDIGYFHSTWKRDVRTDYDSNFQLLRTRGKGHIVGFSLNIQSYNGKFEYLEGAERVFVDGEKRPSIVGTGTEDLFMAGDDFREGLFQTLFSGLIYKNDSLGRISAYRFMVQDAIPFKKSINFSIEHGRNNQEIADYSGTVYWYQNEPHQALPPVPKAIQRIPLRTVTPGQLFEAENLNINLGNIKSRIEDMSGLGPEWSGSREYVIETTKGSEFMINFPKLEDLSYDIEVYYTRGPEFGNVMIFHGSEKAGEIRGYAPMKIPGGKILLKNISNPEYNIDLRFVVEDKDSLSRGYHIGLDGITLNPIRSFIPEWIATGPYKTSTKTKGKSQRVNIDHVFPPEQEMLLKAKREIKQIKRAIVSPGIDGYVSLDELIRPNEPVVTYATTYIHSPESRIMYLYVGSDEAIKVFFNGKQVYRYNGTRFARPDQGQIFLRIQKGWNMIMLKVANQTGNSGFFARILDRENILRYNTEQKVPNE